VEELMIERGKPKMEIKDGKRLRAFVETDAETTDEIHRANFVYRVIDEETIEMVKTRYTRPGVYKLVKAGR
jgi:hypothetical protein